MKSLREMRRIQVLMYMPITVAISCVALKARLLDPSSRVHAPLKRHQINFESTDIQNETYCWSSDTPNGEKLNLGQREYKGQLA